MTSLNPTTQPKPGDHVLIEAWVVAGVDEENNHLPVPRIAVLGGKSLVLADGPDIGLYPRLDDVRWRPDGPDRDGHAAELAEARTHLDTARAANRAARERLAGALRTEQHGLAEMVTLAIEQRDGLAEQLAAAKTEADKLAKAAQLAIDRVNEIAPGPWCTHGEADGLLISPRRWPCAEVHGVANRYGVAAEDALKPMGYDPPVVLVIPEEDQ